MGKIEWTEKSSRHLQAIYEYISKDSKIYAARFIKSLIKATDKLKTMPLCGRIIPELGNYKLREVIYKDYRIAYRIIKDDHIEILAVVHGAREFKTILHQEWEL